MQASGLRCVRETRHLTKTGRSLFPQLSHFPEPRIDLRFPVIMGVGVAPCILTSTAVLEGLPLNRHCWLPCSSMAQYVQSSYFASHVRARIISPRLFHLALLLGISSLTSHPPQSFFCRDFEDRSCTHWLIKVHDQTLARCSM